jgi:hypothetical protein
VLLKKKKDTDRTSQDEGMSSSHSIARIRCSLVEDMICRVGHGGFVSRATLYVEAELMQGYNGTSL